MELNLSTISSEYEQENEIDSFKSGKSIKSRKSRKSENSAKYVKLVELSYANKSATPAKSEISVIHKEETEEALGSIKEARFSYYKKVVRKKTQEPDQDHNQNLIKLDNEPDSIEESLKANHESYHHEQEQDDKSVHENSLNSLEIVDMLDPIETDTRKFKSNTQIEPKENENENKTKPSQEEDEIVVEVPNVRIVTEPMEAEQLGIETFNTEIFNSEEADYCPTSRTYNTKDISNLKGSIISKQTPNPKLKFKRHIQTEKRASDKLEKFITTGPSNKLDSKDNFEIFKKSIFKKVNKKEIDNLQDIREKYKALRIQANSFQYIKRLSFLKDKGTKLPNKEPLDKVSEVNMNKPNTKIKNLNSIVITKFMMDKINDEKEEKLPITERGIYSSRILKTEGDLEIMGTLAIETARNKTSKIYKTYGNYNQKVNLISEKNIPDD